MVKKGLCVLPVILTIILSYLFFGSLWFSVEYLNDIFIFSTLNSEGKQILALFSMGALGGTLYTSIYFAHEYNEMFHDSTKDITPYWADFFGYVIYILRSGIVGIMFYFLFKAGLFLILTESKVEINFFATWLIAFSGGFANVKIIKFLDGFVKDTVDPKNKDKKNIIQR